MESRLNSTASASALAALTLLATGAASLTYETAWQRHLTILVGADHAATAATLAVFLGGLSLGYALCGRLSERVRSPLRAYAWLEVAIGIWGFCFPWTFAAVSRVAESWSFSPPFGLIVGSLGAGALLILTPALLMGATVPFMTRGLAASADGLTGTHARVYGLNTLGAVAGVLLAGFVLLPVYGLDTTLRIAASVNLAAAAAAGLLSLGAFTPAEPSRIGHVVRPDGTRFSGRTLAIVAALSGAATMSQENALIRFGGIVFGGTSYVFALVVGIFIAAIALGSLFVSTRSRISPRALWSACVLSCTAWIVLFWTYDAWPWLAHALRVGVASNGIGFALYHSIVWIVLLAALLPAIAPLGALLPLVFHEHRASVGDSGRVAGGLLGWNALGALLGSLAGGLLLFHVLELGGVLLVAPLLTASMALLVARPAGRVAQVIALGLLLATVAVGVVQPGFDPARLVFGTFRMRSVTPATFSTPGEFHALRMLNRNLVYREDGPLTSVAVVEAPAWDLPQPRPREIYINGKCDSNTLHDRETLRLAAHLPALLAPRRDRSLVVGLGTGVTAGELTLWTDVTSIDQVELSATVAGVLPRFSEQTHALERDPRLALDIEDARHRLRRAGPPWDLIVSEPSNLWNSGNDLLFTLEFFRSIDARLAPGGVLLQWLHLYETDAQVVCSVVATLHAVFPSVRAFRGTPGDWLIVASRGPIDAAAEARARERLAVQPAVAASLRELGVDGVDALLQREVRQFPAFAERARERCEVHRAGSTRLSYRAARALFAGTSVLEPELLGPDPTW